MQIIAQVPGVDQAIESASKEGWLAVFVVVLVFAIVAACGFILRTILNDGRTREAAQNQHIDELSTFIQSDLLAALKANTEMMGKMLVASDRMCAAAASVTTALAKFVAILDVRPCMLPSSEQRRLLAELEESNEKSSLAE